MGAGQILRFFRLYLQMLKLPHQPGKISKGYKLETYLVCNILGSMELLGNVTIPVFKYKKRTTPEGTMINHRLH